MPPPREHVLLVEGKDDREVVYQLCNHHQLDNQNLFTVEAKDGYERLRDDLSVRLRVPALRTIGTIIDADTNLADRWHSVCDVLARSGYTELPAAPAEDGTILAAQGRLPRFGIWVMPDNRLSGMLEDFIQHLVHQGDPLIPRAQTSVDGIPPAERRFQDVHRSKALIHTWLAWQQEPGTPLGLAVTRRYLDANHSLAQRFLTWLRNLFSTP
ncbi:hypothetical protein CYFUS_009400 [Cystobacter fuscus]|uniref:DUF4435 domain-containing protein n=1 Tax=Cystobacter fuscus TaxID=43 RepID=A0A250JJ51_9BACT|nr:DUF3226 domain-containing protein [Cystobacter fuscus]ATB43919.1 hypothetical protein CYFUS_009400 [Cystobacter fuscus]